MPGAGAVWHWMARVQPEQAEVVVAGDPRLVATAAELAVDWLLASLQDAVISFTIDAAAMEVKS